MTDKKAAKIVLYGEAGTITIILVFSEGLVIININSKKGFLNQFVVIR